MDRRLRALWIAGLAVLVGGAGGAGATGDDRRPNPLDPSRIRERMHVQAREALARYDQAVLSAGGEPHLVPVDEPTSWLGEWASGEENRWSALVSGRVVATTDLPQAPHPNGTVRWVDGRSRSLPLVSADEALQQLVTTAPNECDECEPLKVTAARLSTTSMETTRGPAAVPIWEYTLRGSAVRITQLAVADPGVVRVTPPAWDPYDPPSGTSIEFATTSPGRRQLTVTFTGAPGPRLRACGADYTAAAVESPNAVVVIVHEHRNPGEEACLAIGARRTATVTLARPLGERAVLEVTQGHPVPLGIG